MQISCLAAAPDSQKIASASWDLGSELCFLAILSAPKHVAETDLNDTHRLVTCLK